MAKKQGLTPVADSSWLGELARKHTPAEDKLAEAAGKIHMAPDAVERAYMARQLVQCTLPHANPGDVPVWTRTNGDLSLSIQPGWDSRNGCSVGYPYGTIPRLLLFWLIKEAVQNVQNGSRRIVLGRNLARFMKQLGLDPSRGGKRSDAYRVKDQMYRLFRARITFEGDGEKGNRWRDMTVAPDGDLWWDAPSSQDDRQDDLWESWIELGENFYKAIIAAPVPVDVRALKALKRSPLALDLYAWATHKAHSVARKGKQQFIPWSSLSKQFGADYSDHLNFKTKAKAALRKIEAVYPGLKLADATGGIIILPSSRPAVPEAKTKRVGS